jgi:hypothetical protein
MKRLLAILTLVAGLAFAQPPAYPENTVGVGFGINRGLILQASTVLPFSPLGIDTGLDLEVIVPTTFDNFEVWAMFKANVFPALVVADRSLSAGLAMDMSFNTLGSVFGFHLGPVASLEIPGGAISGYVGLGVERNFSIAYGLGARLYLDPIALQVAISDRYPIKIAVLFLW